MTAAPVRYGEHAQIVPGSPCEACGTAPPNPVTDHCHTHGWVRGIVCRTCNGHMKMIDRNVAPRADAVLLAALIGLWKRCPECGVLESPDLPRSVGEKRSNISVAPVTAMTLRAVRVEMSRDGGTMLSVDEVLRALIGSWRESQNQGEVKVP